MAKRNKNIELQLPHIKILVTVRYLNDLGYYPLSYGIYKILMGSIDGLYLPFQYCPTYQTLVSCSSKRIGLLCARLKKDGYLEEVFDTVTHNFYLKITYQGCTFLSNYFSTHSHTFRKSASKEKPAIVFMGDD